MRYIPKPDNSSAKTLLESAKMVMRGAGIAELYNNFKEKKQLNDILREEQKHICCYCQCRIDHFQGNNVGGSHNEHFEPENGANARTDLQLEYTNLYACCNTTKGYEKSKQHCGEYKAEQIISINFLKKSDCSDYFKYNSNGEILPMCPMTCWDEVKNNLKYLTDIQKEAYEMIKGLNLNEKNLKMARRNVYDELSNFAKDKTYGQLQHKVQTLNTSQVMYVPYVDMVLFFLKQFAQNKRDRNT